MKKTITILVLLIVGISSAQMKVVQEKPIEKIGKVGNFAATFLDMTKQEDVYTINYQDLQYKQLTVFQSFSFHDTDNTFENFYKLIIDNFENPPKEDIKVELGNSIVWLKYVKSLGVINVQFTSSNKDGSGMGLSSYMTKKQINKLFGKS